MLKNIAYTSIKDISLNIQYGYTGKTIDNGKVKYLRITDIQNNSVNWENVPFVAINNDEIEKYELHEKDIVFARTGATAGKSYLIEEIQVKSVFASYLIRIIPNQTKINPNYLYLYFQSPEYWKHIKGNVEGAAQPNFNGQKLSKIKVPLVEITEQTRIVNKLNALFSCIDKSITLLEENIKYSQALKSSIIENTFIKLINHSKTLRIKEIAEIKGGKRLPKGETVLDKKTDYPYIRVTDFNDNGSIDLENLKYLNKEVQEQIKRYIITSKDLYISIAGTIGKTGIIPKELDNANLTENAARLVFKSNLKINNRFIYYFTLSNNFKEQVGMATKTVAQPKLALTRLAEVEIPIPSIEMQDKEVKEFDLISFKTNEILKYQQSKLTYLKALKASILDKAFKGEL